MRRLKVLIYSPRWTMGSSRSPPCRRPIAVTGCGNLETRLEMMNNTKNIQEYEEEMLENDDSMERIGREWLGW